MRRIRLFLFSLLLVAVSVSVNSCSSTSIGKLEGQWQLVYLNDLGDPNIYVWNFQGGELVILQFEPPTPVNPNPSPVIGATAQYTTSSGFLKANIEISGHVQAASTLGANRMLNNGVWTIDKIDNEVLRLATTDQEGSNGSYVIREFSKVQ